MTRKATQKYTNDGYLKAVFDNRGNNVKILTKYKNITGLMKVQCVNCGTNKPWFCDARHLLVRTSCPHKRKNRQSTEWYQKKLHEIYDGSIVAVSDYKDARTKVSHKCLNCDCGYKNTWDTLPQHHISYKKGCIKRVNRIKSIKTREKYLEKLKQWGLELVDINTYKGHFGKGEKRLLHRCLKCGLKELRSTRAIMNNPITKYCKACNNTSYSNIAIKWLEEVAENQKVKIEHAKNGGEYYIPGLKGLRADGYCKETNTIYEFYGDIYHGNLAVYKPYSKPHPFRDLTAKQLYTKTMKREELIKKKGYNLVSIWEADYRAKLLHMRKQQSFRGTSPYSTGLRWQRRVNGSPGFELSRALP